MTTLDRLKEIKERFVRDLQTVTTQDMLGEYMAPPSWESTLHDLAFVISTLEQELRLSQGLVEALKGHQHFGKTCFICEALAAYEKEKSNDKA
jgi:hypothetical protein